jgi:hypothetical protein
MMMPSDTLDLATPFDPSRIDDVSRLSNFPTSRMTMSSSTALLARITMLVSAIDTDTSFDPSKMIDDVSTFIFCITTLSKLYNDNIFLKNDDVSTSDTPFDHSMIDRVEHHPTLDPTFEFANSNGYMAKNIGSSKTIFKKNIYFGESHDSTGTSIDADRDNIECDDISILSTAPAPLGLLSNAPADDIPLMVDIPFFRPRVSIHAVGDNVSNFPTPLDFLLHIPADIPTTAPGDSSPPAVGDDVPMLSQYPDPQGVLSTIETHVGDNLPSGLLSSVATLPAIIATRNGDDTPSGLLLTVPVLHSHLLQHAVGDDVLLGILSTLPPRIVPLVPPIPVVPPVVPLVAPVPIVPPDKNFTTYMAARIFTIYDDHHGDDDIPPGLLSHHPDLATRVGDNTPLSSVPALPSRFLPHAVADDIPSGLLSNLPSQFLQDDLPATIPIDSSPSTFPDPLGLLSTIQALRSPFLQDKSTSTPSRRSPSSIIFLQPLKRVDFHTHDPTLLLATLAPETNDYTTLNNSSLTVDESSPLSTLPGLQSSFLQDTIGNELPLDFLSTHSALPQNLATDSSLVSALRTQFSQHDVANNIPRSRFLEEDISTPAPGDSSPPAEISTLWHIIRNHGYSVPKANPSTPFGDSSPSVADIRFTLPLVRLE